MIIGVIWLGLAWLGLAWLARIMPFAFPSEFIGNIQGFAYININQESTMFVKSFFPQICVI